MNCPRCPFKEQTELFFRDLCNRCVAGRPRDYVVCLLEGDQPTPFLAGSRADTACRAARALESQEEPHVLFRWSRRAGGYAPATREELDCDG